MTAKNQINMLDIKSTFDHTFGNELHDKRKLSLSYAALGVLESESLILHKIGAGMAEARGVDKKHATKQVDRLLSNPAYDIWDLSNTWVPHIVGCKKEITVALDWTGFASDEQDTLALNLITNKGSSTPLLWKTVEHKRLKNNRARYEDQMLSRLKEVIPTDVIVTLLADRGFADQKFFKFIEEELGFNYIIRFKKGTFISNNKGESKTAGEWANKNGQAKSMKDVAFTKDNYPLKLVVFVKDKDMKDEWNLASNIENSSSRIIIKAYAKRWKIEPYFRDVKCGRFGYSLYQTHIKSPERRDRLLLIMSLCYLLLTTLGAAGEKIGFDRFLKVNTVKTRTHSLFKQGQYYYDYYRHFTDEQKKLLLESLGDILANEEFWIEILDPDK